MADETLVEREMLTNTFVNGTDYRRGDVVQLTEAQAKAWENLNPPACAEVGHLDKLAEERREYEEELREREARFREHESEQARIRGLHAQGISAERNDVSGEASGEDGPKVPTGEPPVGSDGDGDDDRSDSKSTRTATSSQSGPKVTRSSTARR